MWSRHAALLCAALCVCLAASDGGPRPGKAARLVPLKGGAREDEGKAAPRADAATRAAVLDKLKARRASAPKAQGSSRVGRPPTSVSVRFRSDRGGAESVVDGFDALGASGVPTMRLAVQLIVHTMLIFWATSTATTLHSAIKVFLGHLGYGVADASGAEPKAFMLLGVLIKCFMYATVLRSLCTVCLTLVAENPDKFLGAGALATAPPPEDGAAVDAAPDAA